MNTFYVYKHLRLDTGECFYIGKGTKNRMFVSGDRTQLWKDIANNYGFIAEKIADNLSEKDALEMEKILIKSFRENGLNLINLQNGGDDFTISNYMKIKRMEFNTEQLRLKELKEIELKKEIEELKEREKRKEKEEKNKVKPITHYEYVQQKLSDPKIKIFILSEELKISRYILNKIAKGGDVKFSLVESLYVYFKNSAS